jgi:AraC-like DNA-binding protein
MIGVMAVLQSQPVEVRFPRAGIFLIESHHSDDFRMDWTAHPFFKLLFVLKGTGRLLVPGKDYRLCANEIAVIPRGIRHRINDSPEAPLSLYVLCVQNEAIASFCRCVDHRILWTTAPTALGWMIKNILRNLLYEQVLDDAGSDVVIAGLTLELLGTLIRSRLGKGAVRKSASSSRLLSRARVEAYVSNMGAGGYPRQSLEQAAEQVGLKPRRFSQLFHEITGSSWPAFLRNQRIKRAKHLLRLTDRSIVAICFECGFEDVSNFYRVFRTVENSSPNAWREQKRGRKN